MKKRTQLIMILSALLSLAMLFASCSSDPVNETEETSAQTEMTSEETTEVETEAPTEAPEPTPTDMVVNYGPIIDKWTQYINFTAPTTDDGAKVTFLATAKTVSDGFGNSTVTNVSSVGGRLVLVTETIKGNTYVDGVYKPSTVIKYKVYNVADVSKTIVSQEITYLEEYASVKDTYSISFLTNNDKLNPPEYLGIVEITKGVYNSNRLDAAGQPNPGYDYTYTYIDANGTVLASGANKLELEVLDLGEVDTVRLGDKIYACANSEIIYTYAEGENFRKLAYLPEEYNGYRYYFNNDVVQVANSEFKLVVDYRISSAVTDRNAPVILSNGNVWISGLIPVAKGSADTDYETANAAYKVFNAVIDVTTGEVSEIETNFVITSMITNSVAQKGISLKDNAYQYAEIRRFADGKLAHEIESVILDGKLTETEVLPNFVENQIGIVEVVSNGNLIVRAETPDETLYFTVDVDKDDSATVALYADLKEYRTIIGGFIADGKVYSDQLVRISDLNKNYDEYRVAENGTIIIKSSYYDEMLGTTETYTNVGYIDAYGNFSVKNIANGYTSDPFMGRGYFVGTHGVYNIYGEQLISIYDGYVVTVSDLLDGCSCAKVVTTEGDAQYYIIK